MGSLSIVYNGTDRNRIGVMYYLVRRRPIGDEIPSSA